MKIVTLVPYRESPEFVRTWDVVRPYCAEWGWPIWTGDAPGEFCRSAAINAAAAQGPWDVAVIIDADTIQEAEPMMVAVNTATFLSAAIVPWQTRYKLSPLASERVATEGVGFVTTADLDPDDGFAHPDSLKGYSPVRTGSTIVVHRAAWDAVGGFDEGYRGWGYEDQAFRLSVQRAASLRSIPGTIWHLWHPHQPRDERTKRNGARFRALKAASA